MNKKLVHLFHLARNLTAILAAGTLLAACGGGGATPTHTIGGAVTGLSGTVVLRNNDADNLSVSVNGSFTFAAALANGSAYNVTVLTQPAGQICVVTNGAGTLGGVNVTSVAVACTTIVVGFAYVANGGSNDVSAYTINSAGALSAVGEAVAAGTGPNSVIVDPSGKFLYVANFGSNNILAYSINAVTGALSAVGAAVQAGNTAPASVTVDPSGKFLYVANFDSDTVSAYSINAATGALSAVGAVGAGGTGPVSVTVDPSGKFAYVANRNSDDVSAYSINATTGALSAVGTAVDAGGTGPNSVTVDPSGKFVYVAISGLNNSGNANPTSSLVSAFSINAATGALTFLGAVAAGTAPVSVTVEPSGKFAYVANGGSNNVSAYSINAVTGALTSLGAAVAAGTGPASVTVDRSGKFAYVANLNSNDVSAYSINAATGALTSLGAAVAAGTQPTSVTTTGIIE